MAAIVARIPSPREDALFTELMRVFSEAQTWRATFANQWEETAELIAPDYVNTFYYGDFNWPGQKKTFRQIDATGMAALGRFAAIVDSLITPRNSVWHKVGVNDALLKRDRQTKLWLENLNNILWTQRYRPWANFSGQNSQNFLQLGAFGNGAMFTDTFDDPARRQRGLRYRAIRLGELFLTENHQGMVDGFIRWWRMTPIQTAQKFGAGNLPGVVQSALDKNTSTPFQYLHWVHLNRDYDPDRLDWRGMPWHSVYASVEGHTILEEGGYHTFPMAVSRYMQAPNEVYGRGPAQYVLPSLKTLNAEKKVFLTQGHRAAAPPLLVADDGLISPNVRPDAINKGGINADGKPMIGILPTGQIQITETMMAEERNLINDQFLVSLFQILTETPTMTATEVIERTHEKGILLAPTIGRQADEYLGPLLEREIDLLNQLRLIPPMPPLLREAGGMVDIEYTNPLSKAAKAGEAAGFMRTLQTAQEIVQVTQDPEPLDNFAFDRALPAIADLQSVPVSWLASPDEIAAKRKRRAQAQQMQAQIQAAPAQAAMMKAQAVAAKAGQGPPQQPGMPGQVPVGPSPMQPNMPGA